jgi:predicted nucleotidyltransferase
MLDRIARALNGTPVVAAYLFGSRQCGRAFSDSDTDVAVLLPRGCEASLALLGELTVRLADAGVPSPEVHVLNEASLAFQFEALRGTRAFSADEVQRADYEAWVTLRYLDFEPLLAIQYRIQRRRLAEEGTLGRPGRRGPQAHAA